MAYTLGANLSFGFHNSLVNTAGESSQDLTQDALYLSLCIYK